MAADRGIKVSGITIRRAVAAAVRTKPGQHLFARPPLHTIDARRVTLSVHCKVRQMNQSSWHVGGSRAAGVIIGVLVVALLGSATAKAEGSNLGYGSGGTLRDYDGTVHQYNASGERFRIRGRCQSACTLFLAIRNVCVERSAVLRFHAGSSPTSTARMLGAYDARLRNYLNDHNYMSSSAFHTISGSDMISRFGYKQCPPR